MDSTGHRPKPEATRAHVRTVADTGQQQPHPARKQRHRPLRPPDRHSSADIASYICRSP
jgi:hypothetical protein